MRTKAPLSALAIACALAVGALAAADAFAADAGIHFRRGLEAQEAGNLSLALEEYQAALDLKGDDPAVFHNRALVYVSGGDWAKALADAERAVSLAPRDGAYLVTLGVVLMGVDRPDLKRARTLFIEAADILARAGDTAGFGNACYNLGVMARKGRNFREARRYFELALKADPDDQRALDALAAMGVYPSPPQE
jgi:tetratricopeptide (TPR) repeat protein